MPEHTGSEGRLDEGSGGSGLDAPGAAAREAALRALKGSTDPDAVARVAACLEDENENVRRTAVQVLGTLGPAAGAPVEAVLVDDDAPIFIRTAAAVSLGALQRVEAIAPLVELACGRDHGSDQLRHACVNAVCRMPDQVICAPLADIADRGSVAIVARAVTRLGELATPEAFEAVERAATSSAASVRKAAARALGTTPDPRALAALDRLLGDTEPDVRRRAVQALGPMAADGAGRPLTRTLLGDADSVVRAEAAAALASRPLTDAIVGDLVAELGGGGLDPQALDLRAVATAFAGHARATPPPGGPLLDRLVAASLGGDDRTVEATAAVLLAACGRDGERVARVLDDHERAHPEAAEQLKALRIAVGGARALDPLLRQLQEDLERYFQRPVHELNERTQASWAEAVRRAHTAFKVQVVMSVVVFAIGAALAIASSVRVLVGDPDTATALGAGGTLVGGLGAMLAVTYTGPLKDIRRSTRDLGAATAAFIGFAHQVLQISHAFSALYLRDRVDIDTLERTGRLLRAATADAVVSLGAEPAADPEGTADAVGAGPDGKGPD